MFIARKLLEKIFSPLALALVSLLFVACAGDRQRRWVRPVAWFGLLTLLLPSLPVVANGLLGKLEDFTPPISLEKMPVCDAIVVLGGTVAQQRSDSLQAEELAGSRLLTAVRLYHLGKAPTIVVTSGIGYLTEKGLWRTEAEDMRDILVTMGVPLSAIIVEPQALSTAENASYSARILSKQNSSQILLVSSTYHLRRATLWFEQSELVVHPVGAGRIVRRQKNDLIDFIPTVTALTRTTTALKEYAGLVQFTVRRYLRSNITSMQ